MVGHDRRSAVAIDAEFTSKFLAAHEQKVQLLGSRVDHPPSAAPLPIFWYLPFEGQVG